MNDRSQEKPVRKIAIIGAGNVGLLFLRTFVKKGHNVTSFEQRPTVGGMWNFETKPEEEKQGYASYNPDGSITCSYSSVALNSSKYPILPSEVSYDEKISLPKNHWLSGQQFLHVLNEYADKYGLLKYIKFNTDVQRLDKDVKGWKVTYNKDGEIKEELFDFVVCCSGGFRFPRMPIIENMSLFKGCSIHSSQIRMENQLFPGKTVLVIGSSYSGTDFAYYALKNGAKKVYWNQTRNLTGHNQWMIDRCPQGTDPEKPFDLNYNRYAWFDKPERLLHYLESISTPAYKVSTEAHMVLPGDRFGIIEVSYLLEQEKLSRLQKVGPLKAMTETGAELISGSRIDDVDLVVYCTGYDSHFPILDHIWDIEEQRKNELYYNVLPVNKNLEGVAIAGACDSIVCKTSVYEMQARWLCEKWLTREYDNEGNIFSCEETRKMVNAITQLKSSLPKDFRFNQIADVYALSDCLAKDIGCLPPDYRDLIEKGTKQDVELAIALMKGPLYPMQYRVQGVDAYSKAPQFLIKVARNQLGDEFDSMVDMALKDKETFFKKFDVSKEKYVVQPYFLSLWE